MDWFGDGRKRRIFLFASMYFLSCSGKQGLSWKIISVMASEDRERGEWWAVFQDQQAALAAT